jgi:hypothetical protein
MLSDINAPEQFPTNPTELAIQKTMGFTSAL